MSKLSLEKLCAKCKFAVKVFEKNKILQNFSQKFGCFPPYLYICALF